MTRGHLSEAPKRTIVQRRETSVVLPEEKVIARKLTVLSATNTFFGMGWSVLGATKDSCRGQRNGRYVLYYPMMQIFTPEPEYFGGDAETWGRRIISAGLQQVRDSSNRYEALELEIVRGGLASAIVHDEKFQNEQGFRIAGQITSYGMESRYPSDRYIIYRLEPI